MNVGNQPKVIAITLNYNQVDYTSDCILSILESTYENFQVLLVDNGSTEDNFESLKNRLPQNDKIVISRLEDNLGYVGGINHGLERAAEIGCDYFLIMNNDTLIDKEAIKELVVTAEKYQSNAIVSGKVYNYDEKDTLQYIGSIRRGKSGILDYQSPVKNRREKDIGQFDYEMELAMSDDIMWIIPLGVYEKVGPYSDYFFLYGEQTDFAFKAMQTGYKLIYTPKAKIWHKGGITTTDGNKKSPRIVYWTTMATLKIAFLHFPEQEAKNFFYSWVFKMTIKRGLKFLVGKEKFSVLRAHFLAVSHFRHWNIIRYKDNGYNPY